MCTRLAIHGRSASKPAGLSERGRARRPVIGGNPQSQQHCSGQTALPTSTSEALLLVRCMPPSKPQLQRFTARACQAEPPQSGEQTTCLVCCRRHRRSDGRSRFRASLDGTCRTRPGTRHGRCTGWGRTARRRAAGAPPFRLQPEWLDGCVWHALLKGSLPACGVGRRSRAGKDARRLHLPSLAAHHKTPLPSLHTGGWRTRIGGHTRQ